VSETPPGWWGWNLCLDHCWITMTVGLAVYTCNVYILGTGWIWDEVEVRTDTQIIHYYTTYNCRWVNLLFLLRLLLWALEIGARPVFVMIGLQASSSLVVSERERTSSATLWKSIPVCSGVSTRIPQGLGINPAPLALSGLEDLWAKIRFLTLLYVSSRCSMGSNRGLAGVEVDILEDLVQIFSCL
jgi:hypothetical protein